MLVVRMCTLQLWDMRMGHRIIPPKRFTFKSELIKISDDTTGDEINLLKYVQLVPGAKGDLATCDPQRTTDGIHSYRVALDSDTVG